MQALLRMILGFARTTLFVVLVAAVVLWLAGSQWGQPLRGWIGAASAAAPTTVVVVPTATASVPPTTTVIPTATATPLPTQTLTPTATPYVVQRDAIVRAMANKWTMTTQTAWVETSWQLDTSTNRGMFDRWWNGTQDIEAHAEYDVSAGMDFDRIGVLISAGNKISITLPPARILAVDEREARRTITAARDGLPYTFDPQNQIDVAVAEQIGVEMAADAQQKACSAGVLDRATTQASYAIKEWVLQIHPSLRYQDISVLTQPGVCD
ncbi:MAG: hypothetical protein RLZZ297_2116 [Chloroflexota bacterium]|jgi:hypothetical protein